MPTMGALHAGHLALVKAGKLQADRVIASIFVNPRQFAPGEDFERYPRAEADDAAMLADAGCDLLFAPGVEEVYPPGFATTVSVAELGERWEGAHRPGHFDGVATVVARLLGLARADIALFGEKDWQQLVIVRRMVADLGLATAIVAVPTAREADGLALSSRNAYLSAEERAVAPRLQSVLVEAAARIGRGESAAMTVKIGRDLLERDGFAVDYLALVNAETLMSASRGPGRLIAAARLGWTRLLDNVAVA